MIVVVLAAAGLVAGRAGPAIVRRSGLRWRRGRRSADGEPARLARVVVAPVALGAGWAALGWALTRGPRPHPPLVVAVYLAAAAGLAVVAVVDVETRRLPRAWTVPAHPGAALALGACSLATGDAAAWGRAAAGGFALHLLYRLAHAVGRRRGGLGWGDVMLAGPLGAFLAWLGWTPLLVGAYAGFALSGLAGAALLAARRATTRTALPHAPAMAAGALLGCLVPP